MPDALPQTSLSLWTWEQHKNNVAINLSIFEIIQYLDYPGDMSLDCVMKPAHPREKKNMDTMQTPHRE